MMKSDTHRPIYSGMVICIYITGISKLKVNLYFKTKVLHSLIL